MKKINIYLFHKSIYQLTLFIDRAFYAKTNACSRFFLYKIMYIIIFYLLQLICLTKKRL